MDRELPRTLHSLSRSYQQGCENIDYEVIVVDNGSPVPVDPEMVKGFGDEFQLLRIDDASPSPAAAVNRGAALARGEKLGIIIDGARLLSPGVLRWAAQAYRLNQRAVVSVLGFHLGPEHQRLSGQQGYNQAVEDQLLEAIDWPREGYRLFEISSLAGSSKFGWNGPLAESNCMFLPRSLFGELLGFEEKFSSPGGGLVNLDFYKRACEADDVELYYLAGEGCFHQTHGGITTGGGKAGAERFDKLHKEYRSIRGAAFSAPANAPILLGNSPLAATWLVNKGAGLMVAERQLDRSRTGLMKAAGLDYQFHQEAGDEKTDIDR